MATDMPITSNHSFDTARINSSLVDETSITTLAPSLLNKSPTMETPKRCMEPGAQHIITLDFSPLT